MAYSRQVQKVIESTFRYAETHHYEYVTPEIILLMLCDTEVFALALEDCGGDVEELKTDLTGYIETYVDMAEGEEPILSAAAAFLMNFVICRSRAAERKPSVSRILSTASGSCPNPLPCTFCRSRAWRSWTWSAV